MSWVLFFGGPTGTAAGLSVFAKKSGSVVVPIYCFRKGVNRHVIKVEKPIPMAEGADHQDIINKTTQVYTTKIEEIIRECPEQWMWIHRRWKPGFE